ncbi:MAG: hypothetical protein ACK4WH_13965 [Phycisphaerales bacterium]
MAARTSSSLGVGILVTVLGIATLGLFVTTVIFWSMASNAKKQVADLEQGTQEFIRLEERGRDTVVRFKDPAKRAGKSVVTYLIENQGRIMGMVTGSSGDSADDIAKKFGETTAPNLLALVREQRTQIDSLTRQLADANAAKDRAHADKIAEVKRVQSIDEQMKSTVAALNAELGRYKDEVDALRSSINDYKATADQQVQKIRDESSAREADLNRQLDTAQRENVLNKSLIQKLQDELKGKRVTGQSEYALVDAKVIAVNAFDGTAVIDVGRKNKLTLGMPFAVYSEPTAIRPDERTGEYPEGKASVEVIKVDDDTATVRILREKKGNPVVRGDVLANAVYDPQKTYVFVIYGNFDTNRDGRATQQEQTDYRAKIASWGGKVMDDLSGEVDFLVLGERPVLPPEPASTAPVEVVDEYLRLQRSAKRYDELFRKATETSIPVLNENRLNTLIGNQY